MTLYSDKHSDILLSGGEAYEKNPMVHINDHFFSFFALLLWRI